jgi:hypothetical protein
MTRAEWLACVDPATMLTYLHARTSWRKRRLFAAACCRRLRPLLDDASRRAVEKDEQYADSLVPLDDLWAAYLGAFALADADPAWRSPGPERVRALAIYAAFNAAIPNSASSYHRVAVYAGRAAAQYTTGAVTGHAGAAEPEAQARLLRDIFGDLCRPVDVLPSWLRWNDGTVPRLARAIYDDRRFGDLSILADALEEAGCGSGDLLGHCRGGGEHVRGCWALDLLLEWR